MIASQDFRNIYEKFYDEMRLYLWPYDVLEQLAQVEIDIYSAFIDRDKLKADFYKLQNSIRDVLRDDEDFSKVNQELMDLIEDEDTDAYQTISRVNERNQEKNKALKNPNTEDEEEEEGDGFLL